MGHPTLYQPGFSADLGFAYPASPIYILYSLDPTLFRQYFRASNPGVHTRRGRIPVQDGTLETLEQDFPPSGGADSDQDRVDLLCTLFSNFESICKNLEQLLPLGISCTEAHVLLCFTTVPTLTVSALAGRLGVSPGWASRVSGHLLAKGLLKCSREVTDGRVLKLSATDAALDAIKRVYGVQQEIFSVALRQMHPDEQAVVTNFLKSLAAGGKQNPQATSRIPRISIRRYLIRELWRNRPSSKQTLGDVAEFYRWLEENRPRLLNRKRDPFSNLLSDLDLGKKHFHMNS